MARIARDARDGVSANGVPSVSDHRDAVIKELAESEAALREELVIYRQLAQQALTALHDLTVERNHLREQLGRLRAECRELRTQTTHQKAAA